MKINSYIPAFLPIFYLAMGGCDTRPKERVITFGKLGNRSANTLSDWGENGPGFKGTALSIDIKHLRSALPDYGQNSEISIGSLMRRSESSMLPESR